MDQSSCGGPELGQKSRTWEKAKKSQKGGAFGQRQRKTMRNVGTTKGGMGGGAMKSRTPKALWGKRGAYYEMEKN